MKDRSMERKDEASVVFDDFILASSLHSKVQATLLPLYSHFRND
jgi:hypothetical protein